jgi:SpoVK/Ycf46/Vps4 family AAA+-type ATPase
VDDGVLASLEAAVTARPDDIVLRLHLAELLLAGDRPADAIRHAAAALTYDPESAAARDVMARAMGQGPGPTEAVEPDQPDLSGDGPAGFDWRQAEHELGDVVPPMFVEGDDPGPAASPYDVEPTGIRLDDVGGMTEVKKRLNASFLAPLRNPELRTLYKKSLRGGLLLYGPPGCGKTFLARAIAGELRARFLSVSLADVLDMYVGNSEKNVQELFAVARASAPCVLFLDELDAIGQKRTLTRNSGMRTTVNQLLTELDGIGADNEGVYVLGATNHPWDVDPALRRPGRLDRTLLVLPPDQSAREAILKFHLRDRPVESIDVRKIAKRTDGYSGADLAHICDTASEHALMASAESGDIRMIGMADLEAALAEVRPSIGPWMETARNVALFANQSGEYDELARFLRKQGRV